MIVTADGHNWIHTGAASDYGYDAAGNMTFDPTDGVSMTYDAENRIATATKNGIVTTYTYDADGNRVKKSSGAGGTDIYAQGREAQNNNPTRNPYNLGITGTANNCGTFARDGVAAGGADTSTANSDIRPSSIVSDMQKGADMRFTYDSNKNQFIEKEKK